MTEEWRKVPNWPYSVSSEGRVKRITPGRHTQAGRCLVPTNRKMQVRLSRMVRLNGELVQITKAWVVRRLVWTVFKGDPGVRAVMPLNGDDGDARLSNLALGRRGRKPEEAPELVELRRAG